MSCEMAGREFDLSARLAERNTALPEEAEPVEITTQFLIHEKNSRRFSFNIPRLRPRWGSEALSTPDLHRVGRAAL